MSLWGQSGLLLSDEDLLLARNRITLILWHPKIKIHFQLERENVLCINVQQLPEGHYSLNTMGCSHKQDFCHEVTSNAPVSHQPQ